MTARAVQVLELLVDQQRARTAARTLARIGDDAAMAEALVHAMEIDGRVAAIVRAEIAERETGAAG